MRPVKDTKGILECDNTVCLCDATSEKTLTKCKELIVVRRHTTREDGMDSANSKVVFLEAIADLSGAV